MKGTMMLTMPKQFK